MNERNYALPAAAACLAAIGLPLYWIIILVVGNADDWNAMASQRFDAADVAFLVLGGLMMVAYFGLRSWLQECLSYRTLNAPLLVQIGLTGVFHVVIFLIALSTLMLPADSSAMLGVTAFIGFSILFGLVDLVIAILLLRDHRELPGLLIFYALVSAVLGVLQLTVILLIGALVLLPLQMIILALTLMYRPDVLEVI